MDLGFAFLRCFARQLDLFVFICNADVLGIDATSGYAALTIAVIAITH